MANNSYGIVNKKVIQDIRVSLRAKGLYSLLCTYANKDRKCYPSISTLAEISGVSRRTIERTLNELESFEYIKRDKRNFILQ